MANPFDYCPHCGENLAIVAPVVADVPAAPVREVIRREATSAEKDRIWGFLPLPFQMVPFGVVTLNGEAVALACTDPDKRMWELAKGEAKLLDAPVPAPSASPAAASVEATTPTPVVAQPPTVPNHLCMNDSSSRRAERGAKRYGGA